MLHCSSTESMYILATFEHAQHTCKQQESVSTGCRPQRSHSNFGVHAGLIYQYADTPRHGPRVPRLCNRSLRHLTLRPSFSGGLKAFGSNSFRALVAQRRRLRVRDCCKLSYAASCTWSLYWQDLESLYPEVTCRAAAFKFNVGAEAQAI